MVMNNKKMLRNKKELSNNRVMNNRKMLKNNILVNNSRVHRNNKNIKDKKTNFGCTKGLKKFSCGVMLSPIIVHSKDSSLAHFPP
jgi:hypothetical protein